MAPLFFKNNSTQHPKRIFLDHASTTPLDEHVRAAMEEVSSLFANPSALYTEGVTTRHAVEGDRESIASCLSCKPREIIFTGSGTESCNLAVKGLFSDFRGHIVTTTVEHPAVLESCKALEDKGVAVTYVDTDESGAVSADDVYAAIRPDTRLVSIMYVNNEIGTVQPLRAIGKKIDALKKDRDEPLVFHTDASQAPCYFNVTPDALGVDMMTLDGSKLYGPKGVGVLFRASGLSLEPVIHGGGQEFGVRSGTEDLVRTHGMAAALSRAVELRETESERIKGLRSRFLEKVFSAFPSVFLNGSEKECSPHIVNICFPDEDSEFLVLKLDALGVASSPSSSCRTHHENTSSYVLEAIGRSECSSSSLRFSFGRTTRDDDIDEAVQRLEQALGST